MVILIKDSLQGYYLEMVVVIFETLDNGQLSKSAWFF